MGGRMNSFRPPSIPQMMGQAIMPPPPLAEATTGTDDDQFDENLVPHRYNPPTMSGIPGGIAQVWEPLTPYHSQTRYQHHRHHQRAHQPRDQHYQDHPLFHPVPQNGANGLGKSPSVRSMPAGDHPYYATLPNSWGAAGGQQSAQQGSSATMPRYRAEAVIHMGSRSHHGYGGDGQSGRRPHSSMSHASTKSAPDVIVLH